MHRIIFPKCELVYLSNHVGINGGYYSFADSMSTLLLKFCFYIWKPFFLLWMNVPFDIVDSSPGCLQRGMPLSLLGHFSRTTCPTICQLHQMVDPINTGHI